MVWKDCFLAPDPAVEGESSILELLRRAGDGLDLMPGVRAEEHDGIVLGIDHRRLCIRLVDHQLATAEFPGLSVKIVNKSDDAAGGVARAVVGVPLVVFAIIMAGELNFE